MTLLSQLVDNITADGVRLLHPGERLRLNVGFTALDPEWTWVQQVNGEVTAALLAAPCHGTVMLLRLVGSGSLPRLLRACVKDCRRRGYMAYVTWLDTSTETESHLHRILAKGGAVDMPGCHTLVAGSLDTLGGW